MRRITYNQKQTKQKKAAGNQRGKKPETPDNGGAQRNYQGKTV
jgi:hypothetical protein